MGKKMDARQYIKIRGANENNLKNIDVDIPRNELVVLTGLSGSGKSSLAFDTIYARTETLYGITVFLCKTVSWSDGETGCRKYRRAFTCNFYRSEINEPQSTFHSWNCYGDL